RGRDVFRRPAARDALGSDAVVAKIVRPGGLSVARITGPQEVARQELSQLAPRALVGRADLALACRPVAGQIASAGGADCCRRRGAEDERAAAERARMKGRHLQLPVESRKKESD